MPKPEHDPGEILRLANLVKLMRDAQRAYFKDTQSEAKLKLAKELEQKVDKSVRWVIRNRQPSLFSDPPAETSKGPYRGGN